MSQSVMSKIIFNIQTILWFGLAIIILGLWLFVWLASDPAQHKAKHQKDNTSIRDLPLPVYIESYVQMTKEVPPIDFSTVIRDLRNYPPEFKDKKYFEKHAKRWTVQVMNVSNNDIIAQYLNGRDDRDKFAYFRYHNANDELRYILTYETMGSAQEALSAIKKVNFGLPSTVKLKAEEIGYYVKIMDHYERGMMGLSDNTPVQINLSPTTQALSALPIKTPLAQKPTTGVENKFQNAIPNVPPTNTPLGGATNTPLTANTPQTATPPKPANKPNVSPNTARLTPPTPEPTPEVVVDMSAPPKAPPPKLVTQEPSPAVTYTQGDVVYGEVPKQTARPNTNTASIPGAERD